MLFKSNNSESDLEEGNNNDNFSLNLNTFFNIDNLFTKANPEINHYQSNINNGFNNKPFPLQEKEQNIKKSPLLSQERVFYINLPNKIQKTKKIKKKLGRKKKNSGEKGEHTKYYEDNLERKVKYLFIRAIIDFINMKLKSISNLYVFINNKKYKVNRLLYLGPSITKDLTVEKNLILFETPIKDALYEISGKYKHYPKEYNRVVIEELCKNENCKKIRDILNLKYLDCFKYYRKDGDVIKKKRFACLKGLQKKFENLPQKLKKQKHDKHYEEHITYVINHFENIFYSKIPKNKIGK